MIGIRPLLFLFVAFFLYLFVHFGFRLHFRSVLFIYACCQYFSSSLPGDDPFQKQRIGPVLSIFVTTQGSSFVIAEIGFL